MRTSPTAPTPARSRCRGDAGAAIMETAIVAPFFMFIVLGIMEYGLIFRDLLTLGDAIADSAKFGAIQGGGVTSSGDTADYTMMNLLRQNLAAVPAAWVSKVIIYKGASADAGTPIKQVPPTCRDNSVSSTAAKCNVYPPTDAFREVQNANSAYFKCVAGVGKACGWNPVTRKNGPKNADIEYVGVYVKLVRPMPTKLFGSTFTLEQANIQRIEPGELS